jgi:hypothetical protein
LGLLMAPEREPLSEVFIERGTHHLGASLTRWEHSHPGEEGNTLQPLKRLEGEERKMAQPLQIFQGDSNITARESPYNLAVLSRLLAKHPCVELRTHLLDGLSSGFDFKFGGDRFARVESKNWGDLQHAHDPLVWEKVMKQVPDRTMWGPLDRPPFPNENCPYQAQRFPLARSRRTNGASTLIVLRSGLCPISFPTARTIHARTTNCAPSTSKFDT